MSKHTIAILENQVAQYEVLFGRVRKKNILLNDVNEKLVSAWKRLATENSQYRLPNHGKVCRCSTCRFRAALARAKKGGGDA